MTDLFESFRNQQATFLVGSAREQVYIIIQADVGESLIIPLSFKEIFNLREALDEAVQEAQKCTQQNRKTAAGGVK